MAARKGRSHTTSQANTTQHIRSHVDTNSEEYRRSAEALEKWAREYLATCEELAASLNRGRR